MNIKSTILFSLFSYLLLNPLFASGTPLHDAVARGSRSQCFDLINNGYHVNTKNQYGETPLHEASSLGFTGIGSLLLTCHANVNAKDRYDNTPLHRATFFDKKETCLLLLQNGSDVNAKNRYGNTPLHIASKEGIGEICEVLVLYGSDFRAKNYEGSEAVAVAKNSTIKNLMHLLISCIKHKGNPLTWYPGKGNKEECALLIQQGINISLLSQYEKVAVELFKKNSIKDVIFTYQKIKTIRYLALIKPRDEVPQVIISLVSFFFLGNR